MVQAALPLGAYNPADHLVEVSVVGKDAVRIIQQTLVGESHHGYPCGARPRPAICSIFFFGKHTQECYWAFMDMGYLTLGYQVTINI